MKRALVFVSGALLMFAAAEVVSRHFEATCFYETGSEIGRVATEVANFAARDRSRPALILLGGSDLRESVELDLARPYLAERGIELFDLAMSAHDSLVEKYQTLSALPLGPQDVIVFNIGFEEFMPTEEPNPAARAWETPHAYLERMHLFDRWISPADLAIQALNPVISWLRFRDPLRRCVFAKAGVTKGARWHVYAGLPQDEKTMREKLEKYRHQKMDDGHPLDPQSPYFQMLRLLRERYGKQIVFTQVPRNPLLQQVYSADFFTRFQAVTNEFSVFTLGKNVALGADEFFDFNHMNAAGSQHFTREILPEIAQLAKTEGRP